MSGPRGDVAQRRHPRAGTGSGSYYGNYWHGGGHKGGYYGGHYGGHYKPYYGYGYRPYYGSYYRPYFYGSIYWGWPYYSWPYYAWPYYSTSPYYSIGAYYSSSPSYSGEYYAEGYRDGASREAYPPSDSYDTARAPYSDDDRSREPAPAPRSGPAPAIVLLGESGQLRLEVRPEDASVYVDDEFRGTAADARQLTLAPGRHTIELVRPGFGIERREVEIVKSERTDLLVELRRP